jgi:hypothetical protein
MKSGLGLLARAAIVAAVTGCSAIPVTVNTSTTIRHSDGTVEHKQTHWHGTLDQLPAQVGKAGSDLAQVTGKMAKELTDVPPPGHVQLGDIGPGLKGFQGNPKLDFLASAKDTDGNPIDFQYVQVGAPSYDQFFKDAQTTYAVVYQADQTVHRMRELSAKLLGQKIDASAQLQTTVSQALQAGGNAGADAQPLVDELQQMQQLAASLGTLVSQFASRVEKLVSDGQQLIAGAAASLTNPKVVTHLGLVKQGLGDSVKVVASSGDLLVKLASDLGSFATG